MQPELKFHHGVFATLDWNEVVSINKIKFASNWVEEAAFWSGENN